MSAQHALDKSAVIGSVSKAVIRHVDAPPASGGLWEIWNMAGRALAAAHAYEAYQALSDAELARRDLSRDELPRVAFRALAGE